jgi:hypothetical protein
MGKITQNQQEFIDAVQGTEIFFRDIGCVGVEGNTLSRGGKVVFKIDSKKAYKEFMSAYNMTEYGTDDFKAIMRMEGF